MILPALNRIPGKLLTELRRTRPALLTNASARSREGIPSEIYISKNLGVRLSCIFAPEHGFSGNLPAGETFSSARHPKLDIPIHSLYGSTRRPTGPMLKDIETVIIDMQTLAARPYTYCSTAAMMIEECARRGIRVILLDRPVPVPSTVDGPMLDKRFSSFVSYVPCPMAFGMTLGELALYLAGRSARKPELLVIKTSGFSRKHPPTMNFGTKWIPPSPAITTFESAATYLATVFGESFQSMFETRKSGLPFRSFGAKWLDAGYMVKKLTSEGIEGASLNSFSFPGTKRRNCVRIIIQDYNAFRPAQTAVRLIHCMAEKYGAGMLWESEGFKQDHFDRLWGTDKVRKLLSGGAGPGEVIGMMQKSSRRFCDEREKYLLY